MNQTTLYLYYVYYRLLDVTPPTWSVKGFPTTGPNVLIDLLPGTWYGIRIMASVESGNGIATEEFKVATLEGRTYFHHLIRIVFFVFPTTSSFLLSQNSFPPVNQQCVLSAV